MNSPPARKGFQWRCMSYCPPRTPNSNPGAVGIPGARNPSPGSVHALLSVCASCLRHLAAKRHSGYVWSTRGCPSRLRTVRALRITWFNPITTSACFNAGFPLSSPIRPITYTCPAPNTIVSQVCSARCFHRPRNGPCLRHLSLPGLLWSLKSAWSAARLPTQLAWIASRSVVPWPRGAAWSDGSRPRAANNSERVSPVGHPSSLDVDQKSF
jgi:hypothetical protein